MKIIEGFEAEDDEAISDAADIIKALSPRQNDNISQTFQEYYTPKDPQELLKTLQSILKDVESSFYEQGFNPLLNSKDSTTPHYLHLKSSQNLKKTSFYIVVEDQQRLTVRVYLKHFFETHGILLFKSLSFKLLRKRW